MIKSIQIILVLSMLFNFGCTKKSVTPEEPPKIAWGSAGQSGCEEVSKNYDWTIFANTKYREIAK